MQTNDLHLLIIAGTQDDLAQGHGESLIDVRGIAALTGCTPSGARAWVEREEIAPLARLGRVALYRETEVAERLGFRPVASKPRR